MSHDNKALIVVLIRGLKFMIGLLEDLIKK